MKENKRVRAICEELITIRISSESCAYHTQKAVGNMCFTMATILKENLEKRVELKDCEIEVTGVSIGMTMLDLREKVAKSFLLGYTEADAPQEDEDHFNEHYICQIITPAAVYLADPCAHYQNSELVRSASMNLVLAPVPWEISRKSAAFTRFLSGERLVVEKNMEMFGFEVGQVGTRFVIPMRLELQKRNFQSKPLSKTTELFRSYHAHLKGQVDIKQIRKQFVV